MAEGIGQQFFKMSASKSSAIPVFAIFSCQAGSETVTPLQLQ